MPDISLTATICYPYDERIFALFAPEEKDLGRASYCLARDGDFIHFTTTAHDASALRAALNTITKVLSVWESTTRYGCPR
jgi:tRNA threonylcarbamoyladenosine modification (KEOPS) complex  Pcc1 subunit